MSGATEAASASIHLHSKSFSFASRLLPAHARDHAVAVYAWCRRADDAVDLVEPERQGAALAALEEELVEVYGGGSFEDPILHGFQATVRDCAIPIQYPRELLEGMAMDTRGQRYDTMDQLLEYCHRVAGVVGLMMCHVMRVKDDAALRNAAHLGIAMQLTNIARDVAEDWERDRLYLPDDLLALHGAPRLADRLGEAFPDEARGPTAAATEALLAEADRYYASGDRGLPALTWRCALSIGTARRVYAAIGGRVRAAGCDPMAGRAFVPFASKLRFAGGALANALTSAPARAFAPSGSDAHTPRNVVTFPEDVLPA